MLSKFTGANMTVAGSYQVLCLITPFCREVDTQSSCADYNVLYLEVATKGPETGQLHPILRRLLPGAVWWPIHPHLGIRHHWPYLGLISLIHGVSIPFIRKQYKAVLAK